MQFGTKTIWKIVNSLPQEKLILKEEKKNPTKEIQTVKGSFENEDFI